MTEDSKPLSSDSRCVACGRRERELKPFGGPGDPLVGDFSGEKLVKTWKACWKPAKTEADFKKISDEVRKEEPGLTEEEYQMAIDDVASGGSVGSIWLCRDCILLDEDQLGAKANQRPDMSESRKIDEAIEKEVTQLLLEMPRPHATLGDPKSERNIPINPYAEHHGDEEFYTYQLQDEVEGEQIRTLQNAGWELFFIRADTTRFGHRFNGKLEIRFKRRGRKTKSEREEVSV